MKCRYSALPTLLGAFIVASMTTDVIAGVTVNGEPVEHTAKGIILVREADCRTLMHHKPREDVAYRPGVDAKGDAVSPADLSSNLDLQDKARNFGFVVSVDLGNRLGKGGEGQARPFDAEGYLGYVEVRDNAVYWDGQPLDRDGIVAVSAACRDASLKKDQEDR